MSVRYLVASKIIFRIKNGRIGLSDINIYFSYTTFSGKIDTGNNEWMRYLVGSENNAKLRSAC